MTLRRRASLFCFGISSPTKTTTTCSNTERGLSCPLTNIKPRATRDSSSYYFSSKCGIFASLFLQKYFYCVTFFLLMYYVITISCTRWHPSPRYRAQLYSQCTTIQIHQKMRRSRRRPRRHRCTRPL